MEPLLNAFRSLGPARILALFIGLSATVAISGLVVGRLNTPNQALLYGGLNAQEAGSITQMLDQQNVPYETRGEGAIYVPANEVGRLRLAVAGQGLVGGSNTGYELFDSSSNFGTTNFVQNLNAKRALEGELARTIGTIPAITGARVHIVMPKQALFTSQKVDPTAAIALNVGNRVLEPEQVKSIAHLVASAVPNLATKNITIIDQRGTMLFDGRESESGLAHTSTARKEAEQNLENSLVTMLEKVVGMGKVAVHVTADINTDVVQESSELYDPTQQVVRSEQTTERSSSGSDGAGGGPTGVQNNIPGGLAPGAGGGSSNNETMAETTTNYEIGKTLRQLTRNGGEVKKLSVAVLLEGKVTETQDGEPTYTAYTDEQLARFRKLVETAIGFDAQRGDKVEITDMQFSTPPEAPAIEEPLLTKAQMLLFGQYALLIVALLIVAMMVIRPTLKVLQSAVAAPATAGGLPPMQIGGAGMPGSAPDMVGGSAEGTTIDIQRVEGRVRESSIKKVNDIIDQHPEESLNMVRTWMAQSPNASKRSEENN